VIDFQIVSEKGYLWPQKNIAALLPVVEDWFRVIEDASAPGADPNLSAGDDVLDRLWTVLWDWTYSDLEEP
jgi:hypothetical protein